MAARRFRRYFDCLPCFLFTGPSLIQDNLLGGRLLLDPLLSDAAGQGVAEHELRIRYGGRRRRDLSGTLLAHLLVGDGLEELPNPEPPSVAARSVGKT